MLLEEVISEPLIHSTYVNQNLRSIQSVDRVHDSIACCWFVLSDISQMLGTCSLLQQSRSCILISGFYENVTIFLKILFQSTP